jgi:hypothetical protein
LTSSYTPIIPSSAYVSDGVETFEDTTTTYTTTTVNITGSAGGSMTLNLSTGAMSVTFNTAPVSGVSIWVTYSSFVTGRPTAVLSFDNKFTFYPIPDRAYRFRVPAYATALVVDTSGDLQTEFEDSTDRPLLDQWGPAIVYGAAREVHSDNAEFDAYTEVSALYKEQISYVLRKTHENMMNERSQPSF